MPRGVGIRRRRAEVARRARRSVRSSGLSWLGLSWLVNQAPSAAIGSPRADGREAAELPMKRAAPTGAMGVDHALFGGAENDPAVLQTMQGDSGHASRALAADSAGFAFTLTGAGGTKQPGRASAAKQQEAKSEAAAAGSRAASGTQRRSKGSTPSIIIIQ